MPTVVAFEYLFPILNAEIMIKDYLRHPLPEFDPIPVIEYGRKPVKRFPLKNTGIINGI